MAETKKKANPDYSKSAESLTNSSEVAFLLGNLKGLQIQIAQTRDLLAETEPFKEMTRLSDEFEALKVEIKNLVNKLGGYQDIEQGLYALWQIRQGSPEYPVDAVRQQIDPVLAKMVIEEMVNVTKLEGLVKGGFITEEKLRLCSVPKEPTKAFICKVE